MTFVLKIPPLPHHEIHNGNVSFSTDDEKSPSNNFFERYICCLQFYSEQIAHQQRLIENLENALRYRENEVAEYKAELERLTNSTSWKLTKPLRTIVTVLRK